jgi:hypothetical protein
MALRIPSNPFKMPSLTLARRALKALPRAPKVQLDRFEKSVGAVAGKLGNRARQGAAALQSLPGKAGKALGQVQKNVTTATQGSLEKLGRLSNAEKAFLSTNLHLAKPFSAAADTADALSSSYARKNFKGADADIYKEQAGNALRHATWNALMVKQALINPVGGGNLAAAKTKALEFGNAHEDNPKNTGVVGKAMDLHNNAVGRDVAAAVLAKNPKATDEQLFAAVLDAFRAGKLREVSAGALAVAR